MGIRLLVLAGVSFVMFLISLVVWITTKDIDCKKCSKGMLYYCIFTCLLYIIPYKMLIKLGALVDKSAWQYREQVTIILGLPLLIFMVYTIICIITSEEGEEDD